MMLNTFSVTGLIAWLETQDPATEYDYCNPRDCLICRYFRAHGVRFDGVIPHRWRDIEHRVRPLPRGFQEISQGIDEFQWTYGAALARAKATPIEVA